MFASGKFVVRFQLGHVRVGGAGRKANSSLELIVQASQVIKFMLLSRVVLEIELVQCFHAPAPAGL